MRNKSYPAYTPPVSILIPCYNEEKRIEACINSIKETAYPTYEIIVIDDGSTDNSLNIIKSLENVILITQKHGGKVAGLTKGMKKARYEIVISLDADTTISTDAIHKLVQPLQEDNVAATTGMCQVKNQKKILSWFADVEYQYINQLRMSFSQLTGTSIWFFGFFAAYKKKQLKQIGGFSKQTITEDMDSCLSLNSLGYDVRSVNAYAQTVVPDTLTSLCKQRFRWWLGSIQNLVKHKNTFLQRGAITFLFVNQYWWSFFAFISLPLMTYQYIYWFTLSDAFIYTLGWVSLLGPIRVFYMMPIWGFNIYGIFGVSTGIVNAFMQSISLKKINLKIVIAIFFYFPYTILLNCITMAAVLAYPFKKKAYFK